MEFIFQFFAQFLKQREMLAETTDEPTLLETVAAEEKVALPSDLETINIFGVVNFH